MSLDQAEGVIDTINAESDSQLRASSQLTSGKLTKQIAVLQEDLSDLISEIEVSFDYPEEDIEYKTKTHIQEQIIIIKQKICHSIFIFFICFTVIFNYFFKFFYYIFAS